MFGFEHQHYLGMPANQPSAAASGSGEPSDLMDGACGSDGVAPTHDEKQLLALHRTWCEEDYTWCGQEMTGQLVRKGH
jgi:hypothetical protein